MPNLEIDHDEKAQSLDSKQKNAQSDIKELEQAQKELSSTKAPQAPVAKESKPMPATNEAKAPGAATPKDSVNKVTSKMPIATEDAFVEKYKRVSLFNNGNFLNHKNPAFKKPYKSGEMITNPKTTQAPIPAEQAKITKNILSARLEKAKKKEQKVGLALDEGGIKISGSDKYTAVKSSNPIAQIAPEMFQK